MKRQRSTAPAIPAPTAPQRVEARGKGHSRRGGNRGRTTLVIHNTATKRQAAWAETAQPTTTLRLTRELDGLFDDLRDERKGNPGEPFKGQDLGGALMTPRSPSKDVREIAALAEGLGYEFDRASGGHLVFVHDQSEPLILANSPSDRRWRDNVMAELRRRHPDHPELSRQAKSENRRSSTDRAKGRRRSRRNAALQVEPTNGHSTDTPPVECVPNPGSPEARAQGCRCSRVDNRNGVGVDGADGVFEMRGDCPVHEAEVKAFLNQEQPTAPGPVCECGNPIARRPGPGRPRKWCETCRPSWWRKATESQREAARVSYRKWYDRQKRPSSLDATEFLAAMAADLNEQDEQEKAA